MLGSSSSPRAQPPPASSTARRARPVAQPSAYTPRSSRIRLTSRASASFSSNAAWCSAGTPSAGLPAAAASVARAGVPAAAVSKCLDQHLWHLARHEISDVVPDRPVLHRLDVRAHGRADVRIRRQRLDPLGRARRSGARPCAARWRRAPPPALTSSSAANPFEIGDEPLSRPQTSPTSAPVHGTTSAMKSPVTTTAVAVYLWCSSAICLPVLEAPLEVLDEAVVGQRLDVDDLDRQVLLDGGGLVLCVPHLKSLRHCLSSKARAEVAIRARIFGMQPGEQPQDRRRRRIHRALRRHVRHWLHVQEPVHGAGGGSRAAARSGPPLSETARECLDVRRPRTGRTDGRSGSSRAPTGLCRVLRR